jgi:hypothetical protein
MWFGVTSGKADAAIKLDMTYDWRDTAEFAGRFRLMAAPSGTFRL